MTALREAEEEGVLPMEEEPRVIGGRYGLSAEKQWAASACRGRRRTPSAEINPIAIRPLEQPRLDPHLGTTWIIPAFVSARASRTS